MDIDGDGMVEWPLSSRLPGYETVDAADALWKTTWMTWDYATRQSRQVFSCVMNERDGYYVLFDESWDGKVTAIYDRDTRLLQFRLVGEESTTAPFLSFKAAASSESPEEEGLVLPCAVTAGRGTVQCALYERRAVCPEYGTDPVYVFAAAG